MEPVVVAPTPSVSVMQRSALAAATAAAAAVVIVWHLCEKFFIHFLPPNGNKTVPVSLMKNSN